MIFSSVPFQSVGNLLFDSSDTATGCLTMLSPSAPQRKLHDLAKPEALQAVRLAAYPKYFDTCIF